MKFTASFPQMEAQTASGLASMIFWIKGVKSFSISLGHSSPTTSTSGFNSFSFPIKEFQDSFP